MQLDKNAVERMLSLNDEQLWQAIILIAREAGIDLSKQKLSTSDMSKIRTMLGGASDEDIRRAAEQLEKRKKN